MPSTGYSTSAEKTAVSIHITPTIERDFECRRVFPELRLGNAFRVVHGATGWHWVCIGWAREILADAVDELARFSPVAKSNADALAALGEPVCQVEPVIDCAADSGDGAVLILNKRRAQFLYGEVTNAKS